MSKAEKYKKKDVVKTLFKTSDLCPTQYHGRLKSGKMFYFRFRHDTLTITVSKSRTMNITDAVLGNKVYRVENLTGDPHCGEMHHDEVMGHMGKCFEIPNSLIVQKG